MAALATFAQSRPKLIVGIVVDQMRWTISTAITTSMEKADSSGS